MTHRLTLTMFGSCCEEQEAQEAEYRARIRAATAQSEKRLFGRSLAAARAQSKRCTHLACEGDVCGIECFDCDEEEEDEAHASIEPSGDPRMAGDCDEDEEDEEEAELLRKLRATRLAQFRKEAEKKEAEKRVLGYEYTDERALLQLLNDAAAPFLVCLLGVPDEGELLSQWLDDHLTVRACPCPCEDDGCPRQRRGAPTLPSPRRRPLRRATRPPASCACKTARRSSTACPRCGACPRCCSSSAAS